MYKIKVVMGFMFTIKTWYWGMTCNTIHICIYTHKYHQFANAVRSDKMTGSIKIHTKMKHRNRRPPRRQPRRRQRAGMCQSDSTQRSQRRQGCQRDDPYACAYCNRTNATNERVINAQILDCCNRYRYISNRRYTTTYPTSNHTYNYFNRYKILYVS